MTPEEKAKLIASWPGAGWYDCDEDRERLTHQDPTEAIEEAISGLMPGEHGTEADMREAWPEELTVYTWQQRTVDVSGLADDAVAALSEQWGEEYGDPETDDDGGFGELAEPLAALITEHVKGKHVWRCDEPESFVVGIDDLVGLAKLEWPERFE